MAITDIDTLTLVDAELLGLSQNLRDRAAGLRTQALALDPVLATTYRRRAAELELEAWVAELQSGLPLDQVHPVAA